MNRPRARTRRLAAAALLSAAAVAALSGCMSGGGAPVPPPLEAAPGPTSPSPADTSEQAASAVPAAERECAAVAELHLSLTLLPLAEAEGAHQLDLQAAADDTRAAADDVPAAVRDDFDDAAGLLEGYGPDLDPQELDELRTGLEPVDTWLGRHCSS